MDLTKFTTFTHPSVRDLAWAIGSSVLLEAPSGRLGFNMIDNQWVEDRYMRHYQWLQGIDENPLSLLSFLNKKNDALIGKYFESLLEFWFTHHTDFELVLSNVQVKDAQQTLGEIDFILNDTFSEETYHLEVACKYYYSKFNRTDWNSWWGPNHQDKLSLKMEKFGRQTSLIKNAQGRKILNSCGIPSIPSVVLLKGYFFYPYNLLEKALTPRWSSSHHCAGWCLPLNDLPILADTGRQWCVLPKKSWLAPYSSQNNELPIYSGREMVDLLHAEKEYATKLVAQVEQNEQGYWIESHRALVV